MTELLLDSTDVDAGVECVNCVTVAECVWCNAPFCLPTARVVDHFIDFLSTIKHGAPELALRKLLGTVGRKGGVMQQWAFLFDPDLHQLVE